MVGETANRPSDAQLLFLSYFHTKIQEGGSFSKLVLLWIVLFFLISLYTSVYVVSRTLTTALAIAAAFLPGNGQNATNNVYETAILDHLGPIAPKEIDVFSTTMAKLTIKPGGVAPTIISAKISIKVGC